MAKMIFVNLPVADVERSVAFYEAIGFTEDARFSNPGMCAAMVWSDTITFMILAHDFYRGFMPPAKTIADARATSEALFCLSRDSRAEVDAIVEAAVAAGGKGDVNAPDEHGYMYGRSFEDLDGHAFGPMWMDVDAFLKTQQDQRQPASEDA